MLVKKQKLLHCPECQGEIGVSPKAKKFLYAEQTCRHCGIKLIVYPKMQVKVSKYK